MSVDLIDLSFFGGLELWAEHEGIPYHDVRKAPYRYAEESLELQGDWQRRERYRRFLRKCPRRLHRELHLLLDDLYMWGFTRGKIEAEAIHDGRMVWDDEWQMYVWPDKPDPDPGPDE